VYLSYNEMLVLCVRLYFETRCPPPSTPITISRKCKTEFCNNKVQWQGRMKNRYIILQLFHTAHNTHTLRKIQMFLYSPADTTSLFPEELRMEAH